jgi:NADH-quinone oxidoreductase subunit M
MLDYLFRILLPLLLPILLLIPAAGALLGALLPQRIARAWALGVSLATLLLMVFIAGNFNFTGAGDGPYFKKFEMPQIGASFSLGMDSISFWLSLLTALLTPLAVAASFKSITQRVREYYCWMLLLLSAMLGVFIARDLLVFYVFFELTLIPMFFIIGIWGGPERRAAAGKFFLFTFTGSMLTLAGAIFVGLKTPRFDGTTPNFDIASVTFHAQFVLTTTQRYWVLLALLAGFLVKVPLFPLHTWLPLAHTEAPTAGSVILAGVLLKLGTYGLLRLALPIGLIDSHLGVAFPRVLWWLGVLCVIGVIYGALVAWVQPDIKKLVAYSSVSHLGFCVLGMLALNVWGIEGSVLYMINHGLSTGALFLVVGMVYDRYHTRDINQLSGLAKRMPILAFFFILFTLSSIGLPGLNGFISEFLTILGAFTSSYLGVWFGSFAALGIILGALYMLHMAARVIFGPLKTPDVQGGGHAADSHHPGETADLPADIDGREIAILTPLAIAVVWLGVYPGTVLNSIHFAVGSIVQPIAHAEMEAQSPRPATGTTRPGLNRAAPQPTRSGATTRRATTRRTRAATRRAVTRPAAPLIP